MLGKQVEDRLGAALDWCRRLSESRDPHPTADGLTSLDAPDLQSSRAQKISHSSRLACGCWTTVAGAWHCVTHR